MSEEITLTREELEAIKDDAVFRVITTKRLKQIEIHQKEQNGGIKTSMEAISLALIKINTNSTAIKYIWGGFLLIGGLLGVLLKKG